MWTNPLDDNYGVENESEQNVVDSYRSLQSNFQMMHDPPTVGEWLKQMSALDGILLTIASLSVSFVLSIGLGSLYFARRYISNEASRHCMTWITLMLPITSCLSLIGMYFPRSASFLHIIGTSYLMICLTMVIRLMTSLFGGEDQVLEYMNDHNIGFNLKSQPFCCCFPCLPSLEASKKNLKIIQALVLQTVFVQIVGRMCNIIAFLENSYKHQKIYDISNITLFVSILVSIYGSEILYTVAKRPLSKKYQFGKIYLSIHVSQFLFNFQENVLNLLQKFDLIEPGPLIYPEIRTLYIASFLFCCESLILSIILFFAINPSNNKMCDNYKLPVNNRRLSRLVELSENAHLANSNLQINNSKSIPSISYDTNNSKHLHQARL